jgi:glyceraldehyde-3-phosphate dehydrogenase/erythrose-4-phosphate dehydrogenase
MRIAINGFGQVGRVFLRIARDRGLEVVAVNDLTDAATLAHLLAFDSTYGRLGVPVAARGDTLLVDGHEIAALAEREPEKLPWAEYGVDVVIESTGRFRTREQAAGHLTAGARKVLISAPGTAAMRARRAGRRPRARRAPARNAVPGHIRACSLRRRSGRGAPRRRAPAARSPAGNARWRPGAG